MCSHGCWERATATLDWAEAGLVTAGHGDALSVGRWLSAQCWDTFQLSFQRGKINMFRRWHGEKGLEGHGRE